MNTSLELELEISEVQHPNFIIHEIENGLSNQHWTPCFFKHSSDPEEIAGYFDKIVLNFDNDKWEFNRARIMLIGIPDEGQPWEYIIAFDSALRFD